MSRQSAVFATWTSRALHFAIFGYQGLFKQNGSIWGYSVFASRLLLLFSLLTLHHTAVVFVLYPDAKDIS